MLVGLLASFVYGAGMEILDRCQEAKQCEAEVTRVGLRTQNVLARLEDAQKHFADQAGLDANMYELKGVLENVKALVIRCGISRTKNRSKLSALRRVNPNKKALIEAERKLQGITEVLGIPMLADIKQQLNRMENESAMPTQGSEALARMVRDEIERAMMVVVPNGFTIRDTIESHCVRAGDARQRAPSSQCFGSMVMMLGRVRFEELKEDEDIIGEGTFGTVLSGTYGDTEVAIKKARDFRGSKEVIEAFRQEVEIQYAMRHPNIVEVLAFELGDRGHAPCLVMERMDESLYTMLGASIDIGGVSKVSIVRDVCEGMKFLHSRGILHRDLKSPNILLDEDMVAKISDFGLAKVNNEITTATGCGRGFYSKVGSDFWMAPEVSSNKKTTLASDVFSLHVVMWEVLTHTRAGWGKPIGELLRIDPDARLPFVDMDFSAAVESHLRNIAERSGYKEPSLRPKMAEICSVVSAVLDHLEIPEENPLEEIAPAPRQQRQLQEQHQKPSAQEQQRDQPQPQGQHKQGNERALEEEEERQTQCGEEQVQPEENKGEGQDQACLEEQQDPEKGNDGQQQQDGEQQHTEQEEQPQKQLRRLSLMKRVLYGAKNSRSSHGDNTQGTVETAATVANSIGSSDLCSSSSNTASPAHQHGQEEQQQQPQNPSSVMQRILGGSKEGRACRLDNNLGTLETTGVSTGSNISSSEAKSARPTHRPQLSLDETRPVLTRATARKFASMGSATSSQRSLVEEVSTPSISSSKRDDPPPVRPMKADRVVLFKLLRMWAPSSIASNSTARSEWVNSTGWGTRIDMDDWYGVRTTWHEDDEGELIEWVTEMMLPMNGLCGDLPQEVMTLKCLVKLDLKDNGLTGVISPSIGNLLSLQTLDLSGNGLTGMIPRELGDLVALTVLDLHDNSLQGGIPETLGKLPRLETLDLSNCNLSGCIPPEFEGLEALRVLRLNDNSLTGDIPEALTHIHRLEEIHLSGNQLTGNILAASASWQDLRVLDLSNNSLEGCIPPEIAEFKSLTTLILDRNCYVTGSIPAWIGGMTSLVQIDLSAMQLGGEIPKEIGDLTKLTSLSLGSCQLVGTIPEELGQLTSLKKLALYDNKLTGLIPRAVLKIPTLSTVNFEKNDFEGKQETVRLTKGAIKSALPRGCSVRL